jgi:hypothetical protein
MEDVPSVPDVFSYSVLFQEVSNRSVRGRSYEDTLYVVQLASHLMDLVDKLEVERVLHRRRNRNRFSDR